MHLDPPAGVDVVQSVRPSASCPEYRHWVWEEIMLSVKTVIMIVTQDVPQHNIVNVSPAAALVSLPADRGAGGSVRLLTVSLGEIRLA